MSERVDGIVNASSKIGPGIGSGNHAADISDRIVGVRPGQRRLAVIRSLHGEVHQARVGSRRHDDREPVMAGFHGHNTHAPNQHIGHRADIAVRHRHKIPARKRTVVRHDGGGHLADVEIDRIVGHAQPVDIARLRDTQRHLPVPRERHVRPVRDNGRPRQHGKHRVQPRACGRAQSQPIRRPLVARIREFERLRRPGNCQRVGLNAFIIGVHNGHHNSITASVHRRVSVAVVGQIIVQSIRDGCHQYGPRFAVVGLLQSGNINLGNGLENREGVGHFRRRMVIGIIFRPGHDDAFAIADKAQIGSVLDNRNRGQVRKLHFASAACRRP